jgi:hypothetical protein
MLVTGVAVSFPCQYNRCTLKTLVFYRDRPVGGVAWAWLCGAVTIEPFEVSLWGGGCGGLLWDFNHAGSLVQSRRGRLRASAATVRCGWDCERSVRCGAQGGGGGAKLVKKTC